MRKTLIRKDMDRLRRALDNDLRRMQDLRNQISEKRYELNLNLHNLAFVDEVRTNGARNLQSCWKNTSIFFSRRK